MPVRVSGNASNGVLARFSQRSMSTPSGRLAGCSPADFNRARTFVFTTALPPAIAAAAHAAVDIVDSDEGDRLRRELADRSRALRAALGVRAPAGTGPIAPLIVDDAERAVDASRALLARGFFVQSIRPPTVPTSRLRFAASATLERADIARLGAALAELDLQKEAA